MTPPKNFQIHTAKSPLKDYHFSAPKKDATGVLPFLLHGITCQVKFFCICRPTYRREGGGEEKKNYLCTCSQKKNDEENTIEKKTEKGADKIFNQTFWEGIQRCWKIIGPLSSYMIYFFIYPLDIIFNFSLCFIEEILIIFSNATNLKKEMKKKKLADAGRSKIFKISVDWGLRIEDAGLRTFPGRYILLNF